MIEFSSFAWEWGTFLVTLFNLGIVALVVYLVYCIIDTRKVVLNLREKMDRLQEQLDGKR